MKAQGRHKHVHTRVFLLLTCSRSSPSCSQPSTNPVALLLSRLLLFADKPLQLWFFSATVDRKREKSHLRFSLVLHSLQDIQDDSKITVCFQTGFSHTLPLVRQTESPAPDSRHWLSHCCCARLVGIS